MTTATQARSDTQRPRILLFRTAAWEEWIHTVAEFLAHEGFDVHATCFRYGTEETIEEVCHRGYRLVNITVPGSETAKITRLLRTARAMRRVLQSTAHDILYALDVWTLPSLWIATRGRLRQNGGYFVYHTFEWIEPGVNRLSQVLLERLASRTADLVINAERTRGRLMQKLYGLRRQPLWVRNSLPLEFELPQRNPALRAELVGGQPDDPIVVICPSLVSPERRSLELIQAFRLLPTKYRLVTLAGDGAYQNTCRRLVEKLNLGSRVMFYCRMSFREVMAHIVCSDVGVVLHDGRGSVGNYLAAPMRLSQLAAAGIPCVASALPSVEAVVYRLNLGLCCDEDSPQDIARAIREVAESEPGLVQRGLCARRAFERELHFAAGARGLSAALGSILQSYERVTEIQCS